MVTLILWDTFIYLENYQENSMINWKFLVRYTQEVALKITKNILGMRFNINEPCDDLTTFHQFNNM
jgi:hypothetical protein